MLDQLKELNKKIELLETEKIKKNAL
jgi:hypothetical protein